MSTKQCTNCNNQEGFDVYTLFEINTGESLTNTDQQQFAALVSSIDIPTKLYRCTECDMAYSQHEHSELPDVPDNDGLEPEQEPEE